VPIINIERTQAEKRVRSKKRAKVERTWKESEYKAVLKHFTDNENLIFVGRMVSVLQRLEAQIIEELLDCHEVTDDDVRSCVLENLVRWSEELGTMSRMLQGASELAWEEFEKIDSLNPDVG
jgi:hypothetical protein